LGTRWKKEKRTDPIARSMKFKYENVGAIYWGMKQFEECFDLKGKRMLRGINNDGIDYFQTPNDTFFDTEKEAWEAQIKYLDENIAANMKVIDTLRNKKHEALEAIELLKYGDL
jgi:hypothetical protein